MARRTGHRTVENLLKNTTGAPKDQVATVLAAGTLLVEAADEGTVDEVTGEVCAPSQPWLAPVAAAVAAGQISAAAAQAIGRGLGTPNSAVTTAQLLRAATMLVGQAIAGVDVDKLRKNARDFRDEIDFDGVKVREAELVDLRGLTHGPLASGGGRAVWTMDTLTYALFVDFYHRATSPKLGVRFVDKARADQARKIANDPRTFTQLASDAFAHLLATATGTIRGAVEGSGAGTSDDGAEHPALTEPVLLGRGTAVVRITVAEKALETGVGLARVDGQSAPISIPTVRRMIAAGAKTVRMPFDRKGNYLGTEDAQFAGNRLFTTGQKDILAVKFGACMDPYCDRPPVMTEGHHILFVARDGGKTVIKNGILLCKYHHLKYHNDGYEIVIDADGNYWQIPPTSIDPNQIAIPMPLKTRNLHDLWNAEDRATEDREPKSGTHRDRRPGGFNPRRDVAARSRNPRNPRRPRQTGQPSQTSKTSTDQPDQRDQ